MSPLSYFHTPLISVYKRKMKKTSLWFIKAVAIFQYQYETFLLFHRNFEVIKKGICGTFPGDRKIFAQLSLKVVKVSLEERSLVWYYGSLDIWRNIWIGKNKLTNTIPGLLLHNRWVQACLNWLGRKSWRSSRDLRNRKVLIGVSYFHTSLESGPTNFSEALSNFSSDTQPFCFYVVLSKLSRRDIWGKVPG